MASNVEVDLFCPSCHAVQHLKMPTSVDLGKEPNQQYAILTDSLFTHTCTKCGTRFQVEHELVVVHKDAGYALLLAPDAKEETSKVDAPKELAGLKLRLVRNVNELKEKVLAFENLLDDRTLELCKLYLGLRQEPADQQATLFFAEHRDGQLSFSKLGPTGELEGMVQIPDSLYLELDAKGKSLETDPGKFQRVDPLWVFGQIAGSK